MPVVGLERSVQESRLGEVGGFEAVEVIERIKDAARSRGIVAGIHVASVDYARRVIERGFQFVTIQSDGRLLGGAAAEALAAVRETETTAPRAPTGIPRSEGPY